MAAAGNQGTYDTLMAAIGSGELPSGRELSAATAADRYGVPWRRLPDVLHDLERDGLIAAADGSFVVREPSRSELRELLDLRVLIEVQLARQVAERGLLDAELRRLRALADDTTSAAARSDLSTYIQADMRFHLGLVALAGRPEMVELVRVLRARSRITGLSPAGADGFMTMNAREHHELVDHLAEGSANRVDELLRRHISRIRDEWFGDTTPDD